jgi:MerR family transcriptional regulator, light-induced transcriptional regulator
MPDRPGKNARIKDADIGGVGVPALRVLSSDSAGQRHVRPDYVAQLHEAVLSADRRACMPVVETMIHAGIDTEMIADVYLPAVARVLGEEWCADQVSFAAVTIGVSRLQSLLRELGPEWRADLDAEYDAPAVLVLVGSDVHHTLGSLILSGQLRRRGFCVRMILDARPEDIGLHMRQAGFDAVMISAARCDSLEMVRRLVGAARRIVATNVPVIVGGTILEADPDVRGITGADHTTSDLREALQLCGLKTTRRTLTQSARRN